MKKYLYLLVACAIASCSNQGKTTTSIETSNKPFAECDTVELYSNWEVASVDDGTTLCAIDIVENVDKYRGLAKELYIELKLAEPIDDVVLRDKKLNCYYIVREEFIDTIQIDNRGLYITAEDRQNYLDILDKFL